MQSKVVFLIWVVGCCLLGCKQNNKTAGQVVNHNTEIAFDKLSHSFGKLKGGEIVGCYFNFTNTGKYPLVINKVKPGCGCTEVKYPKEPVLPGEKGEIEIRFDSSGFSGTQYKVVQVFANTEEKMKELVITANVIN